MCRNSDINDHSMILSDGRGLPWSIPYHCKGWVWLKKYCVASWGSNVAQQPKRDQLDLPLPTRSLLVLITVYVTIYYYLLIQIHIIYSMIHSLIYLFMHLLFANVSCMCATFFVARITVCKILLSNPHISTRCIECIGLVGCQNPSDKQMKKHEKTGTK